MPVRRQLKSLCWAFDICTSCLHTLDLAPSSILVLVKPDTTNYQYPQRRMLEIVMGAPLSIES